MFIPNKNNFTDEGLLFLAFNLNKLEANLLSFLRSRKATNLISEITLDDLPEEISSDKNFEKSLYFLEKIGLIIKTKKKFIITKDGISAVKLLKDFNNKPNPEYEKF